MTTQIINNPKGKIVRYLFSRLLTYSLLLVSLLFATCSHSPSPKEYIINPAKIETKNKLSKDQKQFIAEFLPKIRYENDLIRIDRRKVKEYLVDLKDGKTLSSTEKENLNRILKSYDLNQIQWTAEGNNDRIVNRIDSLVNRVDIIPIKLVMAQAIIESGWGTSRFAKEGNNYFGIHCFTKGCGMKPVGIAHSDFEVKVFSSVTDAIKSYLHILNTGYAYKNLRKIRANFREQGKKPDPLQLALGLGQYSQIGDKYASIIKNVIYDYLPKDISALMVEKSD